METALRVIVTILAGYALAVTLVYAFQRSLMYFPYKAVPELAAAGVPGIVETTLTTSDGLSLLSWYRPPAGPDLATMVYFHGNAGSIQWRAGKMRPYLDAGYGLLLVGYRGYGGNPGSPTEEGLYRDGRAALDHLAALGVPADRIVIYGESLGSGVAVQMAAEREIGALVLEAPFTSAADVGAGAYPFLPVRLLIRDRYDSVTKIADIGAPVLIVHGEADRTVPVRLGRALFAAAREPKQAVFIPGAGHEDLYDFGVAREVLAFLDRHLRE